MTRVRRYYTGGETHNAREILPAAKRPQIPHNVRCERRLHNWIQALIGGKPRQDGIDTISRQAVKRKHVGPRSVNPMKDQERSERINEEKEQRRYEREEDRRHKYERKPTKRQEYQQAWEEYTREEE